MGRIGIPELVLILVVVLIVWSILRARGSSR